jgi:hypothetical protein
MQKPLFFNNKEEGKLSFFALPYLPKHVALLELAPVSVAEVSLGQSLHLSR